VGVKFVDSPVSKLVRDFRVHLTGPGYGATGGYRSLELYLIVVIFTILYPLDEVVHER
jgi:hypothetical protein